MKKVYRGKEQIKKAITNDVIEGVVEFDIDSLLFDVHNIETTNEYATNELIGEDLGYLLEDISYTLVGCDVERKVIFLQVSCSAKTLLQEIDDVSEEIEEAF